MAVNIQSSQIDKIESWMQQSRGFTNWSAILLSKPKASSPGIFSKIGSAIGGLFKSKKSKPVSFHTNANDNLRSYDMQSSTMHSTFEWKK